MKKNRHTPVSRRSSPRLSLWGAGVGAVFILFSVTLSRESTKFDFRQFGELPVLSGGRVKPLDTLARSSLLTLSGKQTVRQDKEKISALKWFMEMISLPSSADERPVFRIDDPDVLGLMAIEQTSKRYFSYADLNPHFANIEQQAVQANQLKSDQRSRFQGAILHLHGRLQLYNRLQNTLDRSGREKSLQNLGQVYEHLKGLMAAHVNRQKPKMNSEDVKHFSDILNEYSFLNLMAEFYPLPTTGKSSNEIIWISPGQSVLQSVSPAGLHPGLVAYSSVADALREDDPNIFNRAVSDYTHWLEIQVPNFLRKSRIEYRFNHAAPFLTSLVLYLMAFLLIMASWMLSRSSLSQVGYGLIISTFGLHTLGLILRIYLQGRPPVTNLYSSAIFVGWVAVLLGIFLERRSRKGIGTAVSALIGFVTLIIAHNLAAQGDTLEMMRAVLDSNFWLATHVVCITIGYGSTFLAGTIGIIYILRKMFDPHWDAETGIILERMAYGVVCFSLFFSFTGTILGGIWADQSWGRFWGWDPKENGALMIVFWNVFILHARWSRVAGERGIMAMTVFGNVITSLSWFGVNMLGIGLHSYGFMDKAFFWLAVFVISQFVLMGLAYLPPQRRTLRSKSIPSK